MALPSHCILRHHHLLHLPTGPPLHPPHLQQSALATAILTCTLPVWPLPPRSPSQPLALPLLCLHLLALSGHSACPLPPPLQAMALYLGRMTGMNTATPSRRRQGKEQCHLLQLNPLMTHLALTSPRHTAIALLASCQPFQLLEAIHAVTFVPCINMSVLIYCFTRLACRIL